MTPDSFVIAHELGHNFGLTHAPCGTEERLDHVFPNDDGSIGVWGYDFSEGGRLISPDTPDLMGFCRRPHWISDYHFTNALGFRVYDATFGYEGILLTVDVEASQSAAPARSLLLWGGVDAGGAPFLEPAFVVDAPETLPQSTGLHEVTGWTTDGDVLFSLPFEMPEMAEGVGRSSFAFALPVEPQWAGRLASITLSGPGGAVALDEGTNRPMTILRDPSSGQIRGILRDVPVGGLPLDPGMDVLTSRGIPDPEDWQASPLLEPAVR